MSSKDEHYEKVKHNDKFFNTVKTEEFPDWSVIVTFYRAVHLIESVFALNGVHTNSHEDRKAIMNNDTVNYPHELRRNYRELENLSRQARYKAELPITMQSVDIAQECYDIIRSWYKEKC